MFETKAFKIELIRYGLTITQIAEHLGVARSTVSQVINNFYHGTEIRGRLIRMLGDMQAKKFNRLEDY